MMSDRTFENPQTANLNKVLTDSITMREILAAIKRQEIKEEAETEIKTGAVSGGNTLRLHLDR